MYLYTHTLTNTFFAVRVDPATAADYRVFKDYHDMEMPILLTMRSKKDKTIVHCVFEEPKPYKTDTLKHSHTLK